MKVLGLLVCFLWVGTFSCKPSVDNSIDNKPYFLLSEEQKALLTREEKCKKSRGTFTINPENCSCPKNTTLVNGQCVFPLSGTTNSNTNNP